MEEVAHIPNHSTDPHVFASFSSNAENDPVVLANGNSISGSGESPRNLPGETGVFERDALVCNFPGEAGVFESVKIQSNLPDVKNDEISLEPQSKRRKGQRYASDRVPPPKPRAKHGSFGPEASPEACDPLLGWLREMSAATQNAVVSAAFQNASDDGASEAKRRLREFMVSPAMAGFDLKDSRGEVLFPALGCFAFELALTETCPKSVSQIK